MRKIAIGFLFIFPCCYSFSQSAYKPVAASFMRVNAYSNLRSNVFSFGGNQAALASLKSASVGIYSERRFLLKELSFYSASVAIPFYSGTVGFKGDYFGSSSYNETSLGLAYGRQLGKKTEIGVQFNYQAFKPSGYGSAFSVNGEVGLLYHITENLKFGMHVYNPTGASLQNLKEEKLASVYSAGLGYDVSRNFFIGFEIEKEENQPVNVNAGMHYYFDEKLVASGGITTATSSYYFGFGVAIKNMFLYTTASVHPQLGITPGLSLLFTRPEKK